VVVAFEPQVLEHLVIQALQLDRRPLLGSRRGSAAHVVVRLAGEVEHGELTPHDISCTIVRPRRLLDGVERAEPDARALPSRVTNLRGILARRAAPHTAVLGDLAAVLAVVASAALHYLLFLVLLLGY
jgi:hypothetical protein